MIFPNFLNHANAVVYACDTNIFIYHVNIERAFQNAQKKLIMLLIIQVKLYLR